VNMKSNGNGTGGGSAARWWSSLWGRPHALDHNLEQYRRIALRLHYGLTRPGVPRSALLASPIVSTLSAQSSAALACCLADELRQPILLIDVSPKDPAASRLLECAARPGFADLLSNPELRLDDMVLPTNRENVSFLSAGSSVALFHTTPPDRLCALLQEVESRYDFVLLSGGAVLNNSVTLALAPHAGCVLLLVIENETLMEDLDAAQDALSFCKARQVGLVLATPAEGNIDLARGPSLKAPGRMNRMR